MKVSFRWVRDVAPGIGLGAAETMERLALRGAPVEDAVDLAEGLKDIVIGRVLEAGPHPNADRLTLCRVAGPDGEVPVVCGAPVVRVGAYYPFAPVGAVLPGGLRIGKRKIRGHYSEGMLCSERELELGEDHAGIMLLEGEYEVGAPFAASVGLDDVRMEVEVTPNRGDLLSHVGIARELHPAGQGGIALPPLPGGRGRAGGGADVGTDGRAGGRRLVRARGRRGRFGGVPHPDRGPGTVFPLSRGGDPRGHRGSVAGLAGRPPARGRGASHQQRRRCDELRHAGTGPAPACLRPGEAGRRHHRGRARPSRGIAGDARRRDAGDHSGHAHDPRRPAARRDRRRDGRPGLRGVGALLGHPA